MSNENTGLQPQFVEVAKKLNQEVGSVLKQKGLEGFERAYLTASAIHKLSSLLTPEYMKPILYLQGNKLGYLTDRDRNPDGSKGPGYPEEIVKNCLIEAVLMGLNVYGNEFNIIAGQTYATKSGIGRLLSEFEGLAYDIVCEVPETLNEKTALVRANITWTLRGQPQAQKQVPFAIKQNSYTSSDALIGKATRKARAWLLSTITGYELSEGDAQDAEVVSTKLHVKPDPQSKEQIEFNRMELLINEADSMETLKGYEKQAKSNPDLKIIYDAKVGEFLMKD